MKYRPLTVVALSTLLFCCKPNQLIVKLKNSSGEDFKSVHINVSGKELSFSLKNGQTKSIEVERSYRYFGMQVITVKDTLRFIPIDYVDEKLYTDGKLKMQLFITLNANNKRRLLLETRRNGKKL